MRWVLLAVSTLPFLSGCAVTKVPLCPAIARNSYPAGTWNGDPVNRYVAFQAERRELQLSPLSPFIAEVRGATGNVVWLQRNYRFMLCAFDPVQELADKSTYESCMAHADEWARIVQSEHPEHLLASQTLFEASCATKPDRAAALPPEAR